MLQHTRTHTLEHVSHLNECTGPLSGWRPALALASSGIASFQDFDRHPETQDHSIPQAMLRSTV